MTTNIPALSSGPYKQNNLTELIELDTFRYENLFNVYQNENQQYFYNLLAKVNFPEEISEEYYTTYTVGSDLIPYTLISYKVYNTKSGRVSAKCSTRKNAYKQLSLLRRIDRINTKKSNSKKSN